MRTKSYYFISGRTQSGKISVVGAWTELKGAIQAFVNKYPRFKGFATVYTQLCEVTGEDIVFYNGFTEEAKIIATFNTIKGLYCIERNQY